jgi:hypothetical protein
MAADIQAASEFFAVYADALWDRCDDELLEPPPMVDAHQEFGFWVTYPVRCMRLAEILGLLGLWRRAHGRDWQDIAAWLARLLVGQPGAAHPISDRFALSLAPPAVLLGADHAEILTAWLRDVVKWTADRHEGQSLGLAGVDADPAQELDYLLGDLEHVDLTPHPESLVAGMVLDLASALELGELYDLARHEFLAVEVIPDLRHPPAGADGWLRSGQGLRQELNPPYPDTYVAGDGWEMAPHHHGNDQAAWASQLGLEWEALATWCLLRDRFSAMLLRALAMADAGS